MRPVTDFSMPHRPAATPLAGAGGDVPNTPEGGAAADASDALTALLAGAEQAQKEEDAAAEEQKEQAAEEGDEHSNDDGTKWVASLPWLALLPGLCRGTGAGAQCAMKHPASHCHFSTHTRGTLPWPMLMLMLCCTRCTRCRGFEQCRPLAPFALESSHVVDLQKRGLLYGNDNMYYFLRYHRYLYERMAAARKCCAEKFKPQFKQTAFQTVVPAKQEVRGCLPYRLASSWHL